MANDNDMIDEWTADIDELEREIGQQQSNQYYKHYFLMFMLGLLLLPFASYLTHFIIVLAENSKNSYVDDDDAIKAIASAAVALPFYLSYKITKPFGKPSIKTGTIVLLMVMGLLLFYEYMYFIDYFLVRRIGNHLSISLFNKHMLWSIKHKWLFSVPLVVIWIDIIAYTNIMKYCEWLSFFADIESDEIKFVLYAVIAIIMSAVFRVIFILIS